MIKHKMNNKGFGLIEIVIVTAVVTISLFAFLQAGTLAVKLLRNEKENLESMLLVKEALEAVRAVRDESWNGNIVWRGDNAPYYPVVENGKWKLATSSPGLVNGKYNQYVFFNQVYRDASDRIAPTGTLDTGTKKVTARATTTTKAIELVSYMSNFQSFLPRQQESNVIAFEGATTDGNLANFPSANAGDGDPAQAFLTLASSIQVTKVELYLRRTTAAPSNVYIELRQSPTGTVLGTSNMITGSTISNNALTWVEFRFSDPVSLNAATTYYIRLRSNPSSTDAGSGSAGTINWGYLQTVSSPYAGGEARRYIGRLSNPADAGQILDQYDYGFRVYALQ